MELETKQENIAILLANRTYLYRLLQNFFGDQPPLELINILNSDHTQMALSLLSIEESLNSARNFLEHYSLNKEKALEKCRSEYTRLFIGPEKLPAPPWESVYVTEERLIFQESTLKVRQCYLKYNFLPAHYPSEPDDHIALELDFMYNLSHLAETTFKERNLNETSKILMDQKAFLVEHLITWVPQFVADLKESTSHPLYLGLASMLEAFLKADLVVIEEILGNF